MFFIMDSLAVSLPIPDLIFRNEIRLTLIAAIFLVYEGNGQGKVDPSIQQALEEMGNQAILASRAYQPGESVKAARISRDIPKGPYFFSPITGEVYQAFRLYSDHQLAFTQAAISDANGGYKPLPAAAEVIEHITGEGLQAS